VHPGFHPEGPQGLIDDILQIGDCDILIGIFWKRFGTPVPDAASGTEHEFRQAYDAWKQTGRPQIMMYFNQRAYTPKTREETDQWGQVLEFQRNFPKEGLWWRYKGKAHFERLLRTHLIQVLRSQQSIASKSPQTLPPPDVIKDEAPPPEPPEGLREAYLHWLMGQVRAVPLTGVDPKSIREQTRRDLDLAAVYTALMTQRTDATANRELHPDREARRLSALAVLNAESHLTLLGDPGSGKSTFINFVALCMAGELSSHPEANLAALRAPVPADDEAPPERREEHPQPWDRSPLVPMRVVLRDFVARGLPPAGQPADVSSDTLWKFIIAELPETLQDFARPLRAEPLSAGGLLLLDGLDEVPEADQRRVQVKAAVEQFAATFNRVRVLVTSRTYAYQQQDWKLNGFSEAVLAPFEQAQIRRFVQRWYAYVGQARGLSTQEAQGRAVRLNEAIAHSSRLYELATRPLLLTLMASLHAWRGGTLPDQRQELYADAVDLLLEQWESQKTKSRDDGTYEVIQPSLDEWMRIDQRAMRQVLNRLAFEAHRDQHTLVGTADIAQSKLVAELMHLQQNPDVRPARLIEYLRDRAGLLEPRGVGVYAFPHRTFQEYLAACHLTEDEDFPDNVAGLLRAEPNRWREVTLLAGAKAVHGAAANAWMLAEALCFEDPPGRQVPDMAGYWGALLAAQVLIENNSLARIAERNRARVERICQWLRCALAQSALPPVDRAQAGAALAVIGDPRFRADAWYLSDNPLLGFVEIAAGSFLMGSLPKDQDALGGEKPQHPVTLPTYYMARYPVTVAQFRTFMDASGYQPQAEASLGGLPNHPVVNVTWYDALKYCDWPTECLQGWEGTPEPLSTLLRQEGWRISLPSEAEWEKAVRGTDGRIYPWGDEPDPERANYGETGIQARSAVGCFPSGASPYGVEEVSGNVWEWTRSLWGTSFSRPDFKYPYVPGDGRENPDASQETLRVLRGGAFDLDLLRLVRCASRDWYYPRYRFGNNGFRVGVLPCR
jgi:formylglycine-generating enzyme required for sulfatase activity